MAKPWFRTKQYGYGAGLPCSWEGWVALAVFLGAMLVLPALPAALFHAHPWLPVVLYVGLIVGFIIVAWRKSDQPWRWRWGK